MKYSILYNAVNNIKNDEEVNEIIKDINDCIDDNDDVVEAIDYKLIYSEDILRIAI